MKHILSIFFIFSTLVSYGQSDSTKMNRAIQKLSGKRALSTENQDLSDAFKSVQTAVMRRTPILTMKELRSGMADTANVVQINEGPRSGTFRYEMSDVTSLDDSAMVLRAGNRRYIRQATKITPEMFGAKADGMTDCAEAINKMFRYVARVKGAVVEFGIGTYLTSKTLQLIPGTGSPTFTYNLSIRGAGISATIIRGSDTFSGNLMQADSGRNDFNQRETWLSINDVRLVAGGADRCFYGNYLAGLRVTDVHLIGGEQECMKLGSEVQDGVRNTLNYSVYLTRVVYNAATKEIPGVRHSGSSNGGIIAHQVLFLYADGIEGDNGKYGIYLKNSNEATITQSKIEGTKKAAIWIDGNAGTPNTKITNNYLSNYGGFDGNGVFDGMMATIMVRGTYPYGLTISNNQILSAQSDMLEQNFKISSSSATIGYGACCFIATGGTSSATGNIVFVSPARDRVQIKANSGTFQVGETVTVKSGSTTVGKFKISSIVPNVTYGMKLEGGSGGSTISGNVFSRMLDYSIHSTQNSNSIVGNVMSGKVGIYMTGNGSVVSNSIYSPGGIAIQNVNGLADVHSNTITAGKLSGVTAKNFFTSTIATATGGEFRAYNTTDQTTNYQYGKVGWESGIWTFKGMKSGSAMNTSTQIKSEMTTLMLNPSGDVKGFFDPGTTSNTKDNFQFRGNYTGTGNINVASSTPVINKTGGIYRALLVSPFEQSIVGTKRELFNFGTNSAANATGTHTTQFKGELKGNVLILNAPNLPTYTDNSAAIAGGLVVGDVYKTATGDLKIRY